MNVTNETAAKYGLTADEASKIKDILPTLDLGKRPVGTTLNVTVESPEPFTIKWRDGEEERESPALVVVCDGMRQNLWLSAKSLKQEFARIDQECGGNLHGANVVISIVEYDHEKFGKTRAYRAQLREN